MPTTKARYQITDTGHVSRLLDTAAAAWPEHADDRKALLLRLAERGAEDLTPVASNLDAELSDHIGQWAAIKDDRLLIADADVGVVVQWLREHKVRGQVFRVPGSDYDFGEHGGIG